MESDGNEASTGMETTVKNGISNQLDNQAIAGPPEETTLDIAEHEDEQGNKTEEAEERVRTLESVALEVEMESCNVDKGDDTNGTPNQTKRQSSVTIDKQIESVRDLFANETDINCSSQSTSAPNCELQNKQAIEACEELDNSHAASEEEVNLLPTEIDQDTLQGRGGLPPDTTANLINPAPASSTETSSVGQKRVASSPSSPSSTFSWSEILHVQNLIERCLQQYLTKREILEALEIQAGVDPGFADVVWRKLEEQNPSFFRAYHIQLRLKEQVVAFNYLIAQQKEMTAKRVKRRHLRTPNPSSTLARRAPPNTTSNDNTTSSSIYSPSRDMSSADAFFAGVGGAEDSMSPHSANAFVANLPPPSPLPLPSPIKTDLDTHSFFT